jgi:hypothetical protein
MVTLNKNSKDNLKLEIIYLFVLFNIKHIVKKTVGVMSADETFVNERSVNEISVDKLSDN